MANDKSHNVSITVGGVKYVPLASFFDDNNDDAKRQHRIARRMARTGKLPNARKCWGEWGVPETFDVATIPAPGDARAVKRDDGRERHIVYMTVDESANVRVTLGDAFPDDAFITPTMLRERAKQRRDAKRAAKTDATK